MGRGHLLAEQIPEITSAGDLPPEYPPMREKPGRLDAQGASPPDRSCPLTVVLWDRSAGFSLGHTLLRPQNRRKPDIRPIGKINLEKIITFGITGLCLVVVGLRPFQSAGLSESGSGSTAFRRPGRKGRENFQVSSGKTAARRIDARFDTFYRPARPSAASHPGRPLSGWPEIWHAVFRQGPAGW